MGKLIVINDPDMYFPTQCRQCPLEIVDVESQETWCPFTLEDTPDQGKLGTCPLVETELEVIPMQN